LLEIVQEIGAAAGVAAVVGLAFLSALHCSQARDIKRLREWAGRAPEVAPRPVRRTPSPQRPISRPAGSRTVPRQNPPRRSQPWYSRIGARYVAVALVGVAAYGVTQVTGGSDGSGNRLPDKRKRNGAAVKPGNVTVAVLNGTTVPGLAAALSDQIAAFGFKKGTINDYSDKQLAESVVQYAPGRQAEAKAVGRRLGTSPLEPVTADSRALAGDATVIVIAGADKAP
jgi:LytR cell envelope-related transcriptional attenuator